MTRMTHGHKRNDTWTLKELSEKNSASGFFLVQVPNSRNPNLVPVGDGFGFLFVFDDLDVISKNDI